MPDYWFHSLQTGERVIKRTVQEISRAAQREADKFGQMVQVHVGSEGRKSHRKVSMARNPVARKKTYQVAIASSMAPRRKSFVFIQAKSPTDAVSQVRSQTASHYDLIQARLAAAEYQK